MSKEKKTKITEIIKYPLPLWTLLIPFTIGWFLQDIFNIF